jgi:MFS superfamily sulfate permease-like transporter
MKKQKLMINKNKFGESKAVTLIALVITIIVLLILAGVAIAMLTGENGIISKAMQAKTKTEDSKETEEAGLKEIENYINGKSAEAGVVVQDLKSIKGDGTEGEVIGEKVSDGAGGVVPIPSGFYYVGGTAKSGTVISDNLADKDKYKGQELVGTDLSGNQFVFIPVNGIDEHSRLRYTWFTNAHDTYVSSEFAKRLVK